MAEKRHPKQSKPSPKEASERVTEGQDAGDVVIDETETLVDTKATEEISLKPINEEVIEKEDRTPTEHTQWEPRTHIGHLVKEGKITTIEQIFDQGQPILEATITDVLLPNLETDLLMIGQSKGKFGGGARRVFRQTQKKTMEGNKPSFATFAVLGNKNGIVGLGYGKARETVPAREKAIRNAKINVFKIRRGCGSWQCGCKEPHSIPYIVRGKCGSVEIELIPAPKGKGLVVERECQKILAMAGIKDVWSRTKGQTTSKINLVLACEKALRNLVTTKVQPQHVQNLGITEGQIGETHANG